MHVARGVGKGVGWAARLGLLGMGPLLDALAGHHDAAVVLRIEVAFATRRAGDDGARVGGQAGDEGHRLEVVATEDGGEGRVHVTELQLRGGRGRGRGGGGADGGDVVDGAVGD